MCLAAARTRTNLTTASFPLPDTNKTNYQCKTIGCACVADRFLCGEDGSVSEFTAASRAQDVLLLTDVSRNL